MTRAQFQRLLRQRSLLPPPSGISNPTSRRENGHCKADARPEVITADEVRALVRAEVGIALAALRADQDAVWAPLFRSGPSGSYGTADDDVARSCGAMVSAGEVPLNDGAMP